MVRPEDFQTQDSGAVLLTDGEVTISNVPDILDIRNLIGLFKGMGVKVRECGKGCWTFRADELDLDYIESSEFVRLCAKLRGSVMIAGPLLARFGRVYFPKPGGEMTMVFKIRPFSFSKCNSGAAIPGCSRATRIQREEISRILPTAPPDTAAVPQIPTRQPPLAVT